MPNNSNLYNAAFCAAIRGLSSRWLTSVQADEGATAYATAVDSLISAGSYSSSAAELLGSVASGIWADRQAVSSEPGDYSVIASRTVAMFNASLSGLSGGGGGSVTEVWVNADTGSDSNPGTEAEPVQTFAYAVSLLSTTELATVHLQTDIAADLSSLPVRTARLKIVAPPSSWSVSATITSVATANGWQIQGAGAAWSTDQWRGYYARITASTAADNVNNIKQITANNANTLNLSIACQAAHPINETVEICRPATTIDCGFHPILGGQSRSTSLVLEGVVLTNLAEIGAGYLEMRGVTSDAFAVDVAGGASIRAGYSVYMDIFEYPDFGNGFTLTTAGAYFGVSGLLLQTSLDSTLPAAFSGTYVGGPFTWFGCVELNGGRADNGFGVDGGIQLFNCIATIGSGPSASVAGGVAPIYCGNEDVSTAKGAYWQMGGVTSIRGPLTVSSSSINLQFVVRDGGVLDLLRGTVTQNALVSPTGALRCFVGGKCYYYGSSPLSLTSLIVGTMAPITTAFPVGANTTLTTAIAPNYQADGSVIVCG